MHLCTSCVERTMSQNTFKPNVAFVLIITFTSLALMFSTTSSSTPYQYLLFVQQWSKTVCSNQCKSPSPVFTIHGLWPANYVGPQLLCTGAAFDPAEMNQHPVLKTNLETKSWPDVKSGLHEGFWKHEWNTHGKCSDNVFPQTKYFERCHEMWSDMVIGDMLQKASIVPGGKYSLSDIEKAIKAKTSHDPYIRCFGNKLAEVVICYDYNGQNVVDCKSKTGCSQAPASIIYPN